MVPVEVRAFGFLAVCVILLSVVLLLQWLPRGVAIARPLALLFLVVVIVLGIMVFVMTSQ